MPDPLPQDDDIAPLLRIGLDDDVDVDATLMVTAPTPRTGSTTGAGARGWLPPTVEELQQALPQYEISAFIARGGMGAVYKGTQKTLRRAVAIKVLPPEIEDGDLQFAARFKHEAQSMARLAHPNIVAVHDAGETQNGLLYFVMEFIEGTDLAQLILSEGIIEPLRAIQITTAVCEALAFAHEEGIIHRDIKPSNIMLDKKGRVKVADFGLAKTVNVETSLLTGSNVAMGTPDFIAPEALISGMKVDQRADIYAVGVMLYQMLTGHIPRGRFELPSGMIPKVDKGFDAIVDKAMQTDLEKRYSTATEMKTAVEQVCSASVPDASSPSHRDGLQAGSKSRKPLLLVAAATLVLGTAAWFLMDEPTEAESRPGSPPSVSATVSPTTSALEAKAIRLWDAPDKVPVATGISWQEEAMSLVGANCSSGPESHNAILRVSIRAATPTDTKGASAVLALRKIDPSAINYARLALNLATGKASFSTATSGVALHEWSLPRNYGADEWVQVELRALGDDFTVLVDGQVVGTAHNQTLSSPGKAMLFAGSNGALFRNIVYIPLDGLSEAEARRAAGVDLQATDAPEH
jgi:serine/threonine protein kinase